MSLTDFYGICYQISVEWLSSQKPKPMKHSLKQLTIWTTKQILRNPKLK